MNILLITIPPPPKTPFSTTEKTFPIGLGFIASVLKSRGHTVIFKDFYLKEKMPDMRRILKGSSIDFVGIYLTTICFENFLKIVSTIQGVRKRGLWKGRIIVGGPHTTVCPETIPEYVDHIVQGEGETVVVKIVEGETDERIISGERIRDLDVLPRPDYEMFLMYSKYYDLTVKWLDESPVFVMNTSRGCPFLCAFCSVGSIWGKRYTSFSAKRIVDDMIYLKECFGAKGIYFREDNFSLSTRRVMAICDEIVKENLKIDWVCETRVDTLAKNEEMVSRMAECGCKGVFMGVESASNRILARIRKKITVIDSIKAIELCKKYGIRTGISMMVGIPGETLEERIETVYFAIDNNPLSYWVNIFVGIPSGKLYEELTEELKKGNAYMDENLLIYSQDHNRLVDEVYGGDANRKVNFGISVPFRQILDDIDYAKVEGKKKEKYLEFILLQYIKNQGSTRRVFLLIGRLLKFKKLAIKPFIILKYLILWGMMRSDYINRLARKVYFYVKRKSEIFTPVGTGN